MSAADAGRPVSEAEVLLARREARRFSMRENEAAPELRFGDLDGIIFEDGLDECIGANLVLWLNRMLISAKDAVLRENVERERLDQAAATRPAPAGDGEVVAPPDLTSPEWGRDLFRAVIGESYKPHVWGRHRALHHTSVRFALDMADRSMPEVADVLRAMIWQQVVVDNRAKHAFDRATAAEAALVEAMVVLEPFARYAEQHSMLDDAEGEIGEFYPRALRVSISYRALRAARDFMRKLSCLTPTERTAT